VIDIYRSAELDNTEDKEQKRHKCQSKFHHAGSALAMSHGCMPTRIVAVALTPNVVGNPG
jgi:hypothetical protein